MLRKIIVFVAALLLSASVGADVDLSTPQANIYPPGTKKNAAPADSNTPTQPTVLADETTTNNE